VKEVPMASDGGDDQHEPEGGLDALFEGQGTAGPYAVEVFQDYDPSLKFVAVFAVGENEGARGSSVAYYILEPGTHSGLHADNAEEVIYVADGEGEVFVSGRQVPLEAGTFATMSEGVQHDIYAYGDVKLRLLSFFPTTEIVSTFQEVIFPTGTQILSSRPPAPVVQELSLENLPADFPLELLGAPAEPPREDG
jgi:mannose-6-phosphate isomerase-like protein (cupin superfamily)